MSSGDIGTGEDGDRFPGRTYFCSFRPLSGMSHEFQACYVSCSLLWSKRSHDCDLVSVTILSAGVTLRLPHQGCLCTGQCCVQDKLDFWSTTPSLSPLAVGSCHRSAVDLALARGFPIAKQVRYEPADDPNDLIPSRTTSADECVCDFRGHLLASRWAFDLVNHFDSGWTHSQEH